MGALAPWVVLSAMSLGLPLADWLATRTGYGPVPDEDQQQEDVMYP